MSINLELIKQNKARQALIEAKSLDEIKGILDTATALKAWCQAAKLGIKMQNECAEIKIRAEIKAGEFLREIPKAKNQHGSRFQRGTSNFWISKWFLGKSVKEWKMRRSSAVRPLLNRLSARGHGV